MSPSPPEPSYRSRWIDKDLVIFFTNIGGAEILFIYPPPPIALQDMSEYKCENGQPPMFIPHKPVTGVVGAAFSVVSIMVANILRLFKVTK